MNDGMFNSLNQKRKKKNGHGRTWYMKTSSRLTNESFDSRKHKACRSGKVIPFDVVIGSAVTAKGDL
ncbi:hypothetical protein CDAR_282481 [Caerostris darwini]|uniref:Uncharacterized protein n=1 Tax=Caerostris darwini TaxID=1538125 RepID=A0AAV4MNU8_9ARAC|nr:hypothetical protein CDAR_282481 [Caerostris darwini]